jgi:hypothetical protein
MTLEELKKALKSDTRVKFSQGTHVFTVYVGDFEFIICNDDGTKITYRLFYIDPLKRSYCKADWRTISVAEVEKYDLKKLIDNVFDGVWD